MDQSKQRQSSIELLRILAAMGVVVLHYNNESMGGALKFATLGSPNNWLLLFLESLFAAAVNIFVLITGYFDIRTNKRDLFKPVKLIVEVMTFSLAFYLATVALGHNDLKLRHIVLSLIPSNWFIILYCVLYLISPFINIALLHLSKAEFDLLLRIFIAVFAIYPTLVDLLEGITGNNFYGLSSIGMYGSQYGYTIINFMMVYLIGAYIRERNIKKIGFS